MKHFRKYSWYPRRNSWQSSQNSMATETCVQSGQHECAWCPRHLFATTATNAHGYHDVCRNNKCKDNVYANIHQFKNIKDFILDYKTVLSDFKSSRFNSFREDSAYGDSYKSSYPTLIAQYKKFQRSNSKSVNYMVKEF